MKRECLLSRAYSAPPLTFNGTEIAYSALVNEIMRELENAIFSKRDDGSQTEHLAMVECVLVMVTLAENKRAELAEYLAMPRSARNSRCVNFYLMHEDEVERIKPEIIKRLEAAAAATVESESPGKPLQPVQASSP